MEYEPYATVEQLAAFWRPLTEGAESTRAETLLALASNRLRQIADRVDVDIDNLVATKPPYAATAQWVVMESTKRAMLVPTDTPPANQVQTTAGPYSENIVFTNPSGDLWFKNSELKDLGLWGVQSLSSFSTTPREDIYGS
jgi:hypothetical protein